MPHLNDFHTKQLDFFFFSIYLCQAGRLQKNFCLFSRDYRDFNEQAPFLPHAICSNKLEIH